MSVQSAVEVHQALETVTSADDGGALPASTFLTQTNSLGVVTGAPEVATSIPGLPDLSTVSQPGQTQSSPNTIPPTNTSPTIGQLVTETDAQGSAFTSIFGESTLSTSSGNGISSISTTGTTVQPSSSSASSTASSSPSNHSSSAPIGAIVGGVLGGLAIIGVIIVAVVYILRRHPRSKPETKNTTIEDQPPRYPGQAMHEMPNSVFVPRELDGTQILEMEGRPNK